MTNASCTKKIHHLPTITARLVGVALMLAFAGCVHAQSAAAAKAVGGNSPAKNFQVFDGTLYNNKPDLTTYGIQSIKIIYGQNFWKDKSQMDNLPDERTAVRLAREAATESSLVCIDIENWPVKGDDNAVAESIRKYSQLMQWFQQATPGVRHGYYGVLPVGDYWRAIAVSTSPAYREWQSDNARLNSLAAKVDVVFPSLYTYYPDPQAWVRFAVRQIQAAKKYGKPVYPFLWPQYHDSNRFLKGQFIPADYWKLELETVRAYADGVVIWGGWDLEHDRPLQWDDQAHWWQVTKEFVSTLDLTVSH